MGMRGPSSNNLSTSVISVTLAALSLYVCAFYYYYIFIYLLLLFICFLQRRHIIHYLVVVTTHECVSEYFLSCLSARQ